MERSAFPRVQISLCPLCSASFPDRHNPSVTYAPAKSSRSMGSRISHADCPGDYAASNDQLKQIGRVPQAPKSQLIPGTFCSSHWSFIMWQSPGDKAAPSTALPMRKPLSPLAVCLGSRTFCF